MGWVVVKAGFERENWRNKDSKASTIASNALPLPVALTNKVLFVLFFFASYFLIQRWREKNLELDPAPHDEPHEDLGPSIPGGVLNLLAGILRDRLRAKHHSQDFGF